MGTKTIGIREAVYERLRARKREDESFTDTIDRLIDEAGGDWREGFGSLSVEEAAAIREAASDSRERTATAIADRQRRAVERFETVTGENVVNEANDEDDV